MKASPSVPRVPQTAFTEALLAPHPQVPSQSQPPVAALLHFSFWCQAGPLSLTRQGP